jgi:TM2 domain-containing membrane protein YozV
VEIYITKGIKQIGPHSMDKVRDLIERGEVHETDLAWHEGLSDWVTVSDILQDPLKADETADYTESTSIPESPEMVISELQQALAEATESQTFPPPLPGNSPAQLSSPVSKSNGINSEVVTTDGGKKVIAGLLGILLGGFGVHKFYLGYTKEGFIQLIATFATCGVAAIIALIEGIIYLTMSNENFAKTYISGRKGWF